MRKPISTAAHRVGLTTGLAGALLLTGCGADDPAAEPPGNTDPTTADDTATATPDDVATVDDARLDQQAAGAGAARAAELGFDRQQTATEDELTQMREQSQMRATNSAGTSVDPAECKAPLTALDWSPVLTSTEHASRVDIGSETFQGTGTVEVAAIGTDVGGGESAQADVDDYFATVEELTANCSELTMTVSDTNVPEGYEESASYDFTAESVDTGTDGSSGLLWQRTPVATGAGSSSGQQLTAFVVVEEAGDHVVMVSFVGPQEVGDDEFRQITEQMMTAATAVVTG